MFSNFINGEKGPMGFSILMCSTSAPLHSLLLFLLFLFLFFFHQLADALLPLSLGVPLQPLLYAFFLPQPA